MQKKAVLFDMDGTLIDTFGEMNREAAQKKPNLIERYIQQRIDQLPSYSYVSMMEMIEQDPVLHLFEKKVKTSFDQKLRARYSRAPLKPGAKPFLHRLKAHGYQLCLCTNNARHIVNQILKDHDLEDVFLEIITCYDVEKPKPDPQMYFKALALMQERAEACVVFEDMLEGVVAARAAGIDVIAVDDAYNHKDADEIRKHARFVIHDYEDERLNQLFDLS